MFDNFWDSTIIPGAREPILGPGALSMMRTGIPFFNRDNASTRPTGPAPALRVNDVNDMHMKDASIRAYD